jgi:hypothetical protein
LAGTWSCSWIRNGLRFGKEQNVGHLLARAAGDLGPSVVVEPLTDRQPLTHAGAVSSHRSLRNAVRSNCWDRPERAYARLHLARLHRPF